MKTTTPEGAATVQDMDFTSPMAPGNLDLPKWPAPPLAGYPSIVPLREFENCELLGPTGGAKRVGLVNFDPVAKTAVFQAALARSNVTVPFDGFLRLTLLEPVRAKARVKPGALVATVEKYKPEHYVLVLNNQQTLEGMTLGWLETDAGYFLYEPVDEDASVRRHFIPRKAVSRIAFGADSASLPKLGTDDDTVIDVSAGDPSGAQADPVSSQDMQRQSQVNDMFADQVVRTHAELNQALEHQSRMPMVRVGEALLALRYINQSQLDAAMAAQKAGDKAPLGQLLLRMGIVTPHKLQSALARKMGYPVVDLTAFGPDLEALLMVSKAMAMRHRALPLMLRQGRLVVAVEDPTRSKSLAELEFACGHRVLPVIAPEGTMPGVIEAAYQKLGHEASEAAGKAEATSHGASRVSSMEGSSELLANLEQDQTGQREDDRDIEQSDNSLVRLINSMIMEAQAQGVSDIHIETQPGRQKVRIRFRRDGVLKPYLELPPSYRYAILARIKVMCDLDISERRKPQDGKISMSKFVPGSALELRVSTIPTMSGLEDAVLRLLSAAKLMPLNEIGLSPLNLARLKEVVQRPYGLVLCVGPTGSGKTTTLHSAMSFINSPDRKIWTAEDPVEITQAGLRQVQVNAKIDWTFAKALRAFLRADPDVIMVGEIRDHDTAQVAVESSLTGHLVLSTLHTNSAPETVTRLLDMGMDPFNFGDSLLGVLAQRLVRQLCHHCRTVRLAMPSEVDELKKDYMASFGDVPPPSEEELLSTWRRQYGMNPDDLNVRPAEGEGVLVHYESKGCDHCSGTGFHRRVAIHEMLVVDRVLRKLIQTRSRVDELEDQAIRGGMRTLRQDGIEKVLQGFTTLAEVRGSSNL